VKSLAPQDKGVRRCGCGAFFLLRQCESVGELPLAQRDTRPATERALDPPDIRPVGADDLAGLLAANPPNRGVMIA
jgi:hypothetical protein